ncbi:MAG: dihydroorotase [gamma proteobacterium symbiont of Bathyaustriella thionipta]|nr:dihydroorotase [gamma proteobacterium symbiont of Bathyaustriella thionipta]
MQDILIVNGTLVNEGRQFEADLLLRNGRIEQIGSGLTAPANAEVIDAADCLVLPGMIDDQVHFREPGFPQKADMASESRAALAGGISSIMDMPNTHPQTLSLDALQAKYDLAEGRCRTNYAFYLGASNNNLSQIQALQPGVTCGIKVFMGASTGNMLVDNPDVLQQIFANAGVLIATHCEDTPSIERNEQHAREQFGEEIPMSQHPLIRSREACMKSSALAIELAQQHDARLHVLHITTAEELNRFSDGPLSEKRITAEACVHHLYFSDADYERRGSLIKCNPAIKTAADREAILRAVMDNRIDVIGTDHAPHTLQEKDNHYFNAPAGLPLVQDALPSLFEHVHNGKMSVETLVQKTSHSVAECFAVQERGYLREGYWGDVVIMDTNNPYEVKREQVLAKVGWSPFEGETFRSRVITTLVNGQIAYHKGHFPDQVCGQRLAFQA